MRLSNSTVPIIVACLLLLPVMYVGSYLALAAHSPRRMGEPRIALYRVKSKNVHQFFWPLEQIDRRLRPGFWDNTTYD